MPGPDPVAFAPGDRITLLDPDGDGHAYEGIVVGVDPSDNPRYVNALYRPEGDGSFGTTDPHGEYSIATSLVPAERDDQSYAFREGWVE